jgi:hypothetical protein
LGFHCDDWHPALEFETAMLNFDSIPSRRRRRQLRPTVDTLDERCLLSLGLSPSQVTAAYGLNAITFSSGSGTVAGNGAGETIALIEAYHDPYIGSDLTTFDKNFGLPNPSLSVVNLGTSTTNSGWDLEESMDVEWAHAIAPAANIVVIEAKSQSRSALLAAVNTARNTPGVDVISMSWGFNEFAKEASDNSAFTTPAGHTGITYLASSGDSGQTGAEWPSVAPGVIAVGGTTLYTDRFGAYQGEVAWADSSGGYSHYQNEPGYQRSVQQTGKRSTPDVAFDGDPQTGVAVYQTSLQTGFGSWQVVGGTSLGTPAWAAIIAIADQGRALEGKGSLDSTTQTLPSLYAFPASDFNAVQPVGHKVEKSSLATANTFTGLGTPVGTDLIPGLVASNLTAPLTVSGVVGSTRFKAKAKKVERTRAVEVLHGLTRVELSLRARPSEASESPGRRTR